MSKQNYLDLVGQSALPPKVVDGRGHLRAFGRRVRVKGGMNHGASVHTFVHNSSMLTPIPLVLVSLIESFPKVCFLSKHAITLINTSSKFG